MRWDTADGHGEGKIWKLKNVGKQIEVEKPVRIGAFALVGRSLNAIQLLSTLLHWRRHRLYIISDPRMQSMANFSDLVGFVFVR